MWCIWTFNTFSHQTGDLNISHHSADLSYILASGHINSPVISHQKQFLLNCITIQPPAELYMNYKICSLCTYLKAHFSFGTLFVNSLWTLLHNRKMSAIYMWQRGFEFCTWYMHLITFHLSYLNLSSLNWSIVKFYLKLNIDNRIYVFISR